MRVARGAWVISAVIMMGAVLTLAGCSKKTTGTTTTPDVTKQTPADTTGGNPIDTGGGVDSRTGTTTDRELKDVFFDYDKYNLTPDARSILTGNASYLKEMTALKVTIEGHCDERGTTEYNLALGQRRADAARSYLVDLGIDGSRLATISYGEERPFAPGHDESAWSQNRRAHFVVKTP